MFGIKRLYLFVLQTFLPLFLMTFTICLFIVLMQFLWSHIDDLVGKGLELAMIAKLFFYAALFSVPLALPLSILLAGLMVFGNLGEHFELTAMKSSGVSLLRVMSPLIVFISMVSVGAFFFQNYVQPQSQVKMWTLLFSMRQKSPELDIPEGAFYNQINGYNIYVKHKNRETGVLHDLMIYDVSRGYGFANVILADSGKLSFTDDKKYLFLRLYQGESFEDMRNSTNTGGLRTTSGSQTYRRESFHDKDILMPFDANFNMLDEELMRQQYVGKNYVELRHSIDSITHKVDSVGDVTSNQLLSESFCGAPSVRVIYSDTSQTFIKVPAVALPKVMNIDSLIAHSPAARQRSIVMSALSKASRIKQDYMMRGYENVEFNTVIRSHQIELHKKFTLSLACLIFFFIGAPLGAIIRKGGMGTPIVISILLFVVYFVIDNFGYKMSRDGHWPVWQGLWLSSAVLLPLGVFLTYKAINDSTVLSTDAYGNLIKRLTRQNVTRHLEMKEVVMDDVISEEAQARLDALEIKLGEALKAYSRRKHLLGLWQRKNDLALLQGVADEIEAVVEYLANSRSKLVVNKLMDYPVVQPFVVMQSKRVKVEIKNAINVTQTLKTMV